MQLLKQRLESIDYAIIDYNGYRTMIRVDEIVQDRTIWFVKGYDWVKNTISKFEISKLRSVEEVKKPFLFEGNTLSGEQYRIQVDTAYDNALYVQIKYRKYGGDFSLRTLSRLQREFNPEPWRAWWYSKNLYVRAFCQMRQEDRTFKFERIQEIRVLNFSYE
jgi:predicted DNA-binding transcriptional regulator YafY